MLIGWELYFDLDRRLWRTRAMSLSPIRNGSIEYAFFVSSSNDLLRELNARQRQDPSSREFREWSQSISQSGLADVLSLDACSFAEPAPNQGTRFLPLNQNTRVILFPLSWSGIPRPAMLIAQNANRAGGIYGDHAGVFGNAPDMVTVSSPGTRTYVKPNQRISLLYEVRLDITGATIGSSVDLEAAAVSERVVANTTLNSNETARIDVGFTMPGMLPGERGKARSRHAPVLCEVDRMVAARDEENRENIAKIIRQKAAGLLPGPITQTTEIVPDDACLVDTEAGDIEILGDNIQYEGIATLQDGSARILRGSAPDRFNAGQITAIILRFSRPIATVEDRQIISESARDYRFSRLPSPGILIKAGRWAFSNWRPAINRNGLLMPKIATRSPSIQTEVV